MKNNLIEVKNLEKYFESSKGLISRKKTVVKAVDNISFEIPIGESLGLVGQSGCGKTTTARALCLLDPKTSGSINFYNNETKKMNNLDLVSPITEILIKASKLILNIYHQNNFDNDDTNLIPLLSSK